MDPEVTSFKLTGLKHNALYNFRVYAETEGGMGDALILRTPVRINKDIREYTAVYVSFYVWV